jgi:murein DD-endopeptidase MepM/ murein hydrolase activator NlpD
MALKKLFGTRTILMVSKRNIKSYSVGPIKQVLLWIIVFGIGYTFHLSAKYKTTIETKSIEISNLKKTNKQFTKEVRTINSDLKKIRDYFSVISGYKIINQSPDNKIMQNIDLSLEDQKTAVKIANSHKMLNDIKNATIKHINDLEQRISITGINSDNFNSKKASLNYAYLDQDNHHSTVSLNTQDALTKAQGGPFKEIAQDITSTKDSDHANGINAMPSNIENKIDHLINLEKFIYNAPLSAPMNNYYVSSGFGKRTDPMKHTPAKHEGMDFVGRIGEEVISPSAGRIISAGKFGAYGKALVIDHGYGITTRYGHLSKIYVKKGDYVQKGVVMGTQGNSGRSTGSHLHYEVRYNDTPVNPKKFLEAGKEILAYRQTHI